MFTVYCRLPRWCGDKEFACQCRRHKRHAFDPGWEDPLEWKVTTHFSIIAWEISWTEEPHKLQSMGDTKSWTRLSD